MDSKLLHNNGQTLAYHHSDNGRSPGVLFCVGFNSAMTGAKAVALEAACAAEQISYTRFDYSGHGASSGQFEHGNIHTWLQDTLAVIDQVCRAQIVIVGSSMGAWLATLAALARPTRVTGLIMVAAAPDFTERLLDHRLTGPQRDELQHGRTVSMPSQYDGGSAYLITPQLIANSRQHLVLNRPGGLAIESPVRMLHGCNDVDVPLQCSVDLMHAIQSNDIELTQIEDGDHRLSTAQNINLLINTTVQLVRQLQTSNSTVPP